LLVPPKLLPIVNKVAELSQRYIRMKKELLDHLRSKRRMRRLRHATVASGADSHHSKVFTFRPNRKGDNA
jgi:hypothetical protein